MAGVVSMARGVTSSCPVILRHALRSFRATAGKYKETAPAPPPEAPVSAESGKSAPASPPEAPVGAESRKIPLILYEKFDDDNLIVPPREAWIETLDTTLPQIGLINLHPKVFATYPRLDLIYENVVWQRKIRMVNTAHTKLRSEVRGGGRKPWPQKGLGKARHGSIRSPLWRGGGVVHGPRANTTHFYMLPFSKRLRGLTSTLSVKFAQDDLRVVENLEMPSDEPEYLKKLCEDRFWGPSVLFVDESDIMPRNITLATNTLMHMNMMPVYGLNVYSMLKHETLVLTVAAVRRIEERILYHLNRPNLHWDNTTKFRPR